MSKKDTKNRIINIVSPNYDNNVKDVEKLIKNTHRKYKLRNYEIHIKFKIGDENSNSMLQLLDNDNEIKKYNKIDQESLDSLIKDIENIFGNKKSFKEKYLLYKQKYLKLKNNVVF